VGKGLLLRVSYSPTLNSLRDALRFLALAVVVVPTLDATVRTLSACALGLRPWREFSTHWWAIELGDGIGILVMTPLLLVWLSQPAASNGSLRTRLAALKQWQRSQTDRWRVLEGLVWVALLISLSWFVFCEPSQTNVARYPLEYLPIALMIWAALRFGQQGTVLSGFIISCFAFWGLEQHKGPLLMDANGNMEQAIFLLQAFIGFTMGSALMLAATIAERQQAEIQLRFAAERERLLAETAQRIRRSLDLEEILNTTVAEVRHLLQADRVFIMRLDMSGHSLAVAESVAPHWASVRGWIADQRVAQEIEALFRQEASEQPCPIKRIRAIDDTAQVEKPPLLAEYYRYCQVKASIGIPIMVCHKMFGILLVNQCSAPRCWQSLEINLLEQLATQVEIAIQQGQLYQHVQTLAASLEGQVQERTAELQQRMQELQSLNQVKDLLLHAVAHDLRTPVQGMLMVLKSLRSRSSDCSMMPVPCVKVDRMIQSCDHQLNLLSALLEGHTDDHPAPVLQCQPLHLHQAIESALINLEPLLQENQITLKQQVPLTLPPIKADSQQLQQVLEHLLLNAVKHNAPGLTIKITATIDTSMSSQRFIHCTIADDGQGMSQEQCDRLFHLYVRGIDNNHLTGIGLGLHRCRQMITAHGGQIGVTSHPGKGSQFWFTLPAAERAQQTDQTGSLVQPHSSNQGDAHS
jgi:signal transduction histidine kinase